jgi:hypothetical protein
MVEGKCNRGVAETRRTDTEKRLIRLMLSPRLFSAPLCLRGCISPVARLTRVDAGLPELTVVDRIHECAKRTHLHNGSRIPGTALRYAPGRIAGSLSDRSAVPAILCDVPKCAM